MKNYTSSFPIFPPVPLTLIDQIGKKIYKLRRLHCGSVFESILVGVAKARKAEQSSIGGLFQLKCCDECFSRGLVQRAILAKWLCSQIVLPFLSLEYIRFYVLIGLGVN